MEKQPLFGLGNPNDAFAQYFIGNSYLNQLNDPLKTTIHTLASVITTPEHSPLRTNA